MCFMMGGSGDSKAMLSPGYGPGGVRFGDAVNLKDKSGNFYEWATRLGRPSGGKTGSAPSLAGVDTSKATLWGVN